MNDDLKNLEFVSHESQMLCGMIKNKWIEYEPNYHFLGVPLDISSTYRSGARHGPNSLRNIFHSENFECVTEQGVDLLNYYRIKDWGNVGIVNTNLERSLNYVMEGVLDLIHSNQSFLVFGGDHSTTIGVGRAFEKAELPLHTIYLDAHLDLYSEVMESNLSHACTLRRLTEMNGFSGATVLGYRDFSKDQLAYAQSSNITPISINSLLYEPDLFQFGLEIVQKLVKKDFRIHVSVDLDVLDPSCAPGVGNPVAGGLSSRQLIWLLTGIFQGMKKKEPISWDIVEYNPIYDQAEITGFAVLKLIIEALGIQVMKENEYK